MLTIRKAQKEDISRIVEIHIAAFPQFFLTRLGKRFLNLYYDSVRRHNDGVLLVSEQDGKIIGLCAGCTLSSGFNKRLIISNFFRFGIESLILLFTQPGSLLHLAKNMSKEDAGAGDDGNYAELQSIAVDPNAQRCGAGKSMLEALEDEVKKGDCARLSLTTDYDDNEKAISFYKSLGYEAWYDFVTYPNRKMYRLIKEL